MNWSNPQALWLLSLIPAVIALYFLRMKRREVVVSSTLLWSRVLEDRRVNSPFQRFRRSLLLLLQILAILGLVAALAGPERVVDAVPGRTVILLVDTSASMSVPEVEGTRLEIAQRLARERIEALGDGESAVLIAFARRARALTPVTADRGVLLRALSALEVRPSETHIDEAMQLALSIAKSQLDALGIIISDGRFPDWEGEEIPLPLEYLPVGERTENSGVVALASRMEFGDETRLRIYAEVRNQGAHPASGFLSIYRDGVEVRAAESPSIAPGERWSHSFESEREEGVIEVRWAPAGEDDALALDDRAWLELAPPRSVTVWRAGQQNLYLDAALASIPDLRVVDVAAAEVPTRLQAERPDILLWDGVAPAELPGGAPQIFFGVQPPGVWTEQQVRIEKQPDIVAWDRTHAVNRYVDYGEIGPGGIRESLVFEVVPGTRPVLETRAGALIVSYTHEGVRGLVVGFDTLQSTWPLTLSFTFFLYNAVRFLPADEVAEGAGIRAEELLTFRVPPTVAEVSVRRPDGDEVRLRPEEGGWVRYPDTDLLGPYELRWGDPGAGGGATDPAVGPGAPAAGRHVLPVNLVSARESRIAPRAAIRISGSDLAASAERVSQRRAYWPWLLTLALAVMLGEWWVYHRR